MNDAKQSIVDKLKGANNILVTVSSNPSVDQLSAAIGLTILLNKLKKHATAVFSGQVPSTIEFLQPEDTLEKNTDSLRDFIIALDKSKADKLRYKVEDQVVRIFITPYKTSISQDDLDFSQGDFNVDVVLALGVHEQQDLDQAITTHGRILHDATVMSVNVSSGNELGSINWVDPNSSSLSELAVEIADALGKDQMDGQIATALLTGIVAETGRFSNEKTTPNTMKLAAELMSAGANQQLVANELQSGDSLAAPAPDAAAPPPETSSDGTLEIAHKTPEEPTPPEAATSPSDTFAAPPGPELPHVSGVRQTNYDQPFPGAATHDEGDLLPPSQQEGPRRITEPPVLGGQLTANTQPEGYDAALDPMGMQSHDEPLLDRTKADDVAPPATDGAPGSAFGATPSMPMFPPTKPTDSSAPPSTDIPDPSSAAQATQFEPLDSEPDDAATATPAAAMPQPGPAQPGQLHIDADGNLQLPTPMGTAQPATDASVAGPASDDAVQTLENIEESVHSTHVADSQPVGSGSTSAPPGDLNDARSAVLDAINSAPVTPESLPPKQDIGASGYLNVQDMPDDPTATAAPGSDMPLPAPQPLMPPMPTTSFTPDQATPPGLTPADTPLDMPLPPGLTVPPANPVPPTSTSNDPLAPPPVPPPMTELPPFSPPK